MKLHRAVWNLGFVCLASSLFAADWPMYRADAERSGPVVAGDAVYYAAGVWPSSGVDAHALNAATGRVVSANDRAGQLYVPQPHGGANARSGVGPQGYLLADCSMISQITKDDPPIIMTCSVPDREPQNRSELVHHPRHARAVKKRCDEAGVKCDILLQEARGTSAVLEFLLQHPGVVVAKPTEAAPTPAGPKR